MDTNVSEETLSSVVRVEVLTLKMEAVCSFEMLITDHNQNLKYSADVTI
jgi:hypothetical protein